MPESGDRPTPLETKTYRFAVDGTRPVLQFDLTSGGKDGRPEQEKLTIELHAPMSGEVFEARTSKGRLEVDRDGKVMYFCQAPDSASFTFFLGRSVVVSMSRKTGEVTVESPSRLLSVERADSSSSTGDSPPTSTIKLKLE